MKENIFVETLLDYLKKGKSLQEDFIEALTFIYDNAIKRAREHRIPFGRRIIGYAA